MDTLNVEIVVASNEDGVMSLLDFVHAAVVNRRAKLIDNVLNITNLFLHFNFN